MTCVDAEQAPSVALGRLLDRLDLTAVGIDVFIDLGGPEPLHRIFGGQVAAQALVAMGRTVDPGLRVGSLHVQFFRPARSGLPLELHVRRLLDGGARAVRQVDMIQDGKLVLGATAEFHGDASTYPVPTTPAAPPLPPRWEQQFAGKRHRLSVLWEHTRPVDIRFVDPPMLDAELDRQPRPGMQTLVRADGPLPDDPLLHAGVIVYASDTTLLETALLPVGRVFADGDFDAASLDHAMWFHRPVRADRWLRFDQHAVALAGGRGLAAGRLVDEDGDLAVTVIQEGSLRPTRGQGSWLARSAAATTKEGRR